MKIGLLAYSTNTGLGYQTWEFYKHMNPDKVLLVDLSQFNKMPTNHERFPNSKICEGIPKKSDCEWLVNGMDLVFVCETPLNYYLFEYASKMGVKTIQQYNYEFLDYFRDSTLPKPTLLASPSFWGLERVKKLNLARTEYLPVPVDITNIEFREIEEVKTFIHIIGRPTACDRNGTLQFLEAIKLLGKKYKYKIYLQTPTEERSIFHFKLVKEKLEETKNILEDNLEIITNCENNLDMYKEGEILVLPRKYGGLCLPMWESLASGVPVIMTDISPNYTNLPKNWLVESELSGTLRTQTEILLYEAKIVNLVARMLIVAQDIKKANKIARKIAENISWKTQKLKYLELFKNL